MEPDLRRLALVGRAGYGAVLLLAPRGVLSQFSGEPCDESTVRVARLLGARQVLQAAVLYARSAPAWQLGGAGVDLLHGLSMLGVAAVSPKYRKVALISARDAGVLALAAAIAA